VNSGVIGLASGGVHLYMMMMMMMMMMIVGGVVVVVVVVVQEREEQFEAKFLKAQEELADLQAVRKTIFILLLLLSSPLPLLSMCVASTPT